MNVGFILFYLFWGGTIGLKVVEIKVHSQDRVNIRQQSRMWKLKVLRVTGQKWGFKSVFSVSQGTAEPWLGFTSIIAVIIVHFRL